MVFLAGLLVAIPGLFSRLFRPDIIVRVKLEKETIPPDLEHWLMEFGRVVRWQENTLRAKQNVQQELAEIFDHPVAKKLPDPIRELDLDRLTLAIVNQSANVASGLRLRLDNVYQLWSAETTGTFLTPKEQVAIRDQIINGYRDRTIIVPSLVPIPPDSSLEISLYGNLESAEPTLNIVGYSVALRKIVEVEDGLLVHWYLNPLKLLLWMPSVIFVLIVVSVTVWERAKRQTIIKATKNILYDSACSAAREGRVDDAMALLRQAVIAGYSNLEHVKNDSDLRALHGRADFEALFDSHQQKA